MKSTAWSRAAWATLAIALAAAAASTLAAGRFAWGTPEIPKAQGEALRPDTAGSAAQNPPALHYGERVMRAVVREPENTWSNLPFVFVGVLILFHDRRVLSGFLGAAFIALGLSSGLYHASLLPAWRTVDVAAMGWAIVALALFALSALGFIRPGAKTSLDGRPTRQVWLSVLGGGLAVVAAVFRNDVRIGGIKPFDSTYVTAAGMSLVLFLLVAGIALARKKPPVSRLLLLGLVTAVAILCQCWDHPGQPFFRPGGMVQAHALWHILMAWAVALAFDLFLGLEGRPTLWAPAP